MSTFVWDEHTREFWRDQARMHPHGIASTLAGLSDLLDAAEKRAAAADRLRAQITAVEVIHRPTGEELICGVCMDSRGANQTWPCDTAEALSGVA